MTASGDPVGQARVCSLLYPTFLCFLAIVFAGFGRLCPLLQSFDPYFDQLGYVSLGLVAAFVGVDKFFGLSSAWMRYMMK